MSFRGQQRPGLTFQGRCQEETALKSVYLAVSKTVLDADAYFRWNKSHDQS
jgi:hypothetical protein